MAKKLILDIDEDTWKEVLKYKIDKNHKNNKYKPSTVRFQEVLPTYPLAHLLILRKGF